MRITLIDRDVPSYFQSLEHLLARPPFALERLSVRRGEDSRISRVRYVLPRHKVANRGGPGRGRKSTRPGANGVGGHAARGDAIGDCYYSCATPPSQDTSQRQSPNSWPGWARSFLLRARGVVVTSGSSHSSPIRGRSPRWPPAGAGPLRTGESQAGEGQDGFARVKQHLRQSRRSVDRPPTGPSSSGSTTTAASFKRRRTICP